MVDKKRDDDDLRDEMVDDEKGEMMKLMIISYFYFI